MLCAIYVSVLWASWFAGWGAVVCVRRFGLSGFELVAELRGWMWACGVSVSPLAFAVACGATRLLEFTAAVCMTTYMSGYINVMNVKMFCRQCTQFRIQHLTHIGRCSATSGRAPRPHPPHMHHRTFTTTRCREAGAAVCNCCLAFLPTEFGHGLPATLKLSTNHTPCGAGCGGRGARVAECAHVAVCGARGETSCI